MVGYCDKIQTIIHVINISERYISKLLHFVLVDMEHKGCA